MSQNAVVSLDEYRQKNGISLIQSQAWPLSRDKDFRVAVRERADQELRTVYCGFCGASSPELDGPAGRAWFAHHTTNGDCTRRVVA